ncbi:glycoside hydrolase family 125 protein [Kitasatospora cineracea]|uniref:glycoside hydrolase family 125 protein n=1 Tax=Kitasatospora cineracea TaxID=88074 RepID=UPI0037BD955C
MTLPDPASDHRLPPALRDLAGRARQAPVGASPHAAACFGRCFADTWLTSMRPTADGDVFVTTGGIPAMWLRDSAARNIGVNGPGFHTDPTPGDFDGALALTGRFTGGSFQDVLVYWPSGPRPGLALVLAGDGSGGPLPGGGVHGHLTDWSGGNAPTQVVEGGNVSGRGTGLADLLGIAPNGSGGTSLTLYASGWPPGAYGMSRPLTAPTPDGDRNWNDWTIASTELPAAGGGTSTALYLWKKSTGELTLWKDLAADPGTGTLTYRAFPVATGWNTGADLTLQAADIDSDGTPDLWTLDGAGHVTADLVTGLGTGAPATVTEVAGTLAG